jgi:uncharacterized protein
MIALGIVLVLAQTVIAAGLPFAAHFLQIAVAAGGPRSAEAAKQLAELSQGFGIPSADKIAQTLELHRGGYGPLVAKRFDDNMLGPVTVSFLFGAETLAYMLFGMAGLRSGLLRGEWPRASVRRLLWLGFGIGIPAYAAIAAYMINQDFSLFSVMLGVMTLATPVRPFMILGWACLILLLARPGGALTERIAAAGRMAFTNYLATSVICTTFFYGYGFGWFGYLSRAELYLVVFAVWALILIWSKPWLARFRYGPLEWLWRSLARGKLQPMGGGAGTLTA